MLCVASPRNRCRKQSLWRERESLLRHLRKHGCYLKREGRGHSLWMNPQTGAIEAIPRHIEIPDRLALKICRGLAVPEIGR